MKNLPATLILALSLVAITFAFADDKDNDSVDRDYSGELPRIKPMEPAAALKSFTLQPGFRIEQVAAEPVVVDPVAMAWDEDGRMFVIEMRGYSEDDGLVLGRVRMLVDSDEDGRYDKSTVYADGLSWPTALTYSRGGLYVGAAPNIFYFKDTDGDGKADEKRLVYTGFGKSNVQGLMNTFKWGYDNRIHGAVSSSGAIVEWADDKTKPKMTLRGRDFSFDPKTHDMQPTSGGGQHGLSFNQWGEKFVCSNSNHIQQVMFDDHYLARNPYVPAPGSRRTIAADGPQADVYRSSPVEPWRIVRTRLRAKKIVPGVVEGGGRPAGYFTGATGVTIFRGNAWPREYQGWAVVGDVGSNLVHRKKLEPQGTYYVAKRVDEKSELLTSSDIWFRPVQFSNAPDGALYIADMYREVIEHPKSLPPPIKKHLDLTSGRDRGRIYRIVGDDFQQPQLPQLTKASTAELVATLDHENGWHRETAARLLYERHDRTALSKLDDVVSKGKLPEGRIRALYALATMEALTPAILLDALSDKHPRVRTHAIRLSESHLQSSLALRNRLVSLVSDDDIHVRYQLAFSLGAIVGSQKNEALASLAARDGADMYVQTAIQSSLVDGAGEVLRALASNEKFRQSKHGKRLITSLAKQIGKQQSSADIASLLTVLPKLAKADTSTMQLIVNGLALKAGSPLAKQMSAATGGKAEMLTKQLLADAATTLQNEDATTKQKLAAVQSLRLGTFKGQGDVLAEQLAPSNESSLQAAALETLGQFDDGAVADVVISRWSSLTPSLRGRAADILFSRTIWLSQLLTAVETKKIALADIEPGQLKLLASHSDAGIQSRAKKLISQAGFRKRDQVVAAYRGALKLDGDRERGRAVFKKVCSTCHQVQGVGHPIGPNLAAMRNRGPEAVLLNVLDPNREVNPKYLTYNIATEEGRTFVGMIAEETATSITLLKAENKKDTILRIDIDQMKSSGVSLMPEGLEKDIDQQKMADLIEYLRSIE